MRIAGAVACCLLLVMPALSPAETLAVRPTIEISERFDSNVANAPHGHESSDFVTRATPKLTGILSAFSTKLSLIGGFDAEYFGRHSELNRFSMTRNFDLAAGEPMKITPQFLLRPSAHYLETRDEVRRNQLSQTTVQGLAPTETQVSQKTGVRDYAGALNGIYAVSANIDFGLGGGAARKSYFDGSPLLIGVDTYSANSSVDYKWTPSLTSGVYGTVNYDSFDNKNDVRNFSAGFSGKCLFSPSSMLDGRVGLTWIHSDDMTARITKPSGRIQYSHKSAEFLAALSASIDYAAGAFGAETKREDVTLHLSNRFSADWSGDTAGVWQTNRSLKTPYIEDQMSVQWTAGVHYALAEYARLNLSGDFFRQWNRGGIGADLYRESAMVGFEIGSNFKLF